MKRIVIHYDEIALKGGRRRLYARRLVENIRKAGPALAAVDIDRQYDRILAGPFPEGRLPEVKHALAAVPGIAWFAEVTQYPLETDSLESIAPDVHVPLLAERAADSPGSREISSRSASSAIEPSTKPSFRVQTRRSNKNFPLDSNQVNHLVGARIQQRTGWPVDLENPDLTVYIDVTQKGILVYQQKQRGLGGLPVGSSGKLICLISGGIDSPVAAFKMICRGCRVVFVHFHNFSPDSGNVRDKNVQLARQLARYQNNSRLYLLPFAPVQADLVAGVPPEMRMVAYRRAMLKLAEPILQREEARGFIVGDSIGQVASQTLENLQATYAATDYPVFAPLIGESKRAIIELARHIGTYQTSTLPYDDCCQHLVASSPETRCRLSKLIRYEQQVPLDAHTETLNDQAEVIDVTARPAKEPA